MGARRRKYRLNLGLDLQGGIHMVMRVDTKHRAAEAHRAPRRSRSPTTCSDKKLGEVTADTDPEALQLTLTAKDPATMDAVEKEVAGDLPGLHHRGARDGDTLVLAPDESQVNRFREEAVDQAMLVIRRRIDKWGVAEVDVRKLGTDSIQISLPGPAGPGAGQGADRHHRAAGVPAGGRPAHLLRGRCSRRPRPRPSSEHPLVSAEGFPQLRGQGPRGAAGLREGQGARRTARCCSSAWPSPVKKGDVRQLPHLPGGEERAADGREPVGRGRDASASSTSRR